MSLAAGDQLGPYKILSMIGKGGMGEVFRATDTRLSRSVAIKVIPPQLAAREDLRNRFEVEARSIASLNHPHICALYDIGEQDGLGYMVMEYLEGESLAQRLKKGPLPLPEALQLAADLAGALEQAHRRGVVHRDFKPGNIMLTRTGVKLLDFGLAQLRATRAASPDDLTLPMTQTQEGTVLGTPQYMAPEQVEGKEADARSDMFAFGSVLYEMVTGKRAFARDSQAAVMSAILRCETPAPLEAAPAALTRALQSCWSKDPDERWQSAGDLRRELQWIAQGRPEAQPVQSAGINRREMVAWGAAALFGAAGTAAMLRALRPASPEFPVHFTITEPPGMTMNLFQCISVASPDGKMVALSMGAGGRQSIWVRALDSLGLREVPDTNGALNAFWSPDGRSIAFFAEEKLKRVSLAGGPARVICEMPPGGFGTGAWSREGTIAFSVGFSGALYHVSAEGGKPALLTSLETSGHTGHVAPSFLPDGKTVLFTATATEANRQGVYAVKLDSKELVRVSPVSGNVAYLPPGFLLSARQGNLVAQRFDAASLQVDGDPIPLANGVFGVGPLAHFGTSVSGVLTYAEEEHFNGQLAWFDRSGRQLEAVGSPGPYVHMDLSLDQRRLLLERYEDGHGEIWVLDLARGVPTRLTFGPGWNFAAYWSPDGTRFIGSEFGTTAALVQRDAGGKREKQLLETSGPTTTTHWSPDGRYLVYSTVAPKTLEDLWVLPLFGDQKPSPYLQTGFLEGQGRVSPDGRWLAYVSNESGTPELYVGSFPAPGAKWRITTKGGGSPKWRADGKELFYLAPDQTLMAVSIPGTPERAGNPEPLFKTPIVQYGGRMNYAPSTDGKRFLLNTKLDAGPHAIHVITNWTPGTGK